MKCQITQSQLRSTAKFADRLAELYDQHGKHQDADAARKQAKILRKQIEK